MKPYLDISKFDNFLQLVFDNVPAFIFWKDRNSVYLGCNQNYAEAIGLTSPSDIVGKTDYELWPDKAEEYRQDDQQVIKYGRSKERYREYATLPNGKVFWVEMTKVPLRDKSDNIIGVLGLYRDITAEKKEEEKIEKKLKLQLEKAEEVYCISNGSSSLTNSRLSI